MELEISKVQEGSVMTMTLEGRIDTYSAPSLTDEIMAIPDDVKDLVIDLSGVEYVSSAGIRSFNRADKEMHKRGGKLVIRGANEFVSDLFELTGFGSIVEIQK